jgi:hypothetical protein
MALYALRKLFHSNELSLSEPLSQFVSGFHHQLVLVPPALDASGFESARSITDSTLRYAAKNLAKHLIGIQGGKACHVPIRKDVLTGRHKADLSRKDRLLFRRKSHGHSYKVVGQ